MICKPCGVAGDMVVLFRGKNHDGTVLPVANMLHGMCNNCDCQHKIDFEGKTVQKADTPLHDQSKAAGLNK